MRCWCSKPSPELSYLSGAVFLLLRRVLQRLRTLLLLPHLALLLLWYFQDQLSQLRDLYHYISAALVERAKPIIFRFQPQSSSLS